MTGLSFPPTLSQGAAPTSNWPGALSRIGLTVDLLGGFLSGAGAYYGAKSQAAGLLSQSLSAQHQRAMSQENARLAEIDANMAQVEGRRRYGEVSARGGAIRGARRASQAAAGVAIGQGSAAEVAAADELATELELSDVRRSTLEATQAAKHRRTNYQNEALLAGTSADNLRRSAGNINPGLALSTSLIGSASSVAREWRYSRRRG